MENAARRWGASRLRWQRRRQVRPRSSAEETSSPSIAREVTKFVSASLAASLVFVLASPLLLRHLGRSEAVRESRITARLAAAGIVEPNLDDDLLRGDRQALARLDRVVQERVLSNDIVRVKIWSSDGRILYSDEPRLIGAHYPLGEEEQDVLASGEVDAALTDLDRPQNRFERAEGELLAVYSRVRTPDGTPLLFEVYERYDSVVAGGRRIWLTFLPALLGALVLLWVVQVPLAYRLARRVREGDEDREILLRRALDASNDERRRIAIDLHDDVVQNLAGVSYSLAAAVESAPAARADPELRATLEESAATTRGSVRRLRALLPAIHPPNLLKSGLEPALADVIAPLERRGIHAELAVDSALSLAPQTEAMIFRAAREAVRNVLEHAEATRVAVRVESSNGLTRLTVEDDGTGFDHDQRARRREEGHIGLELLEELAARENAHVDIRSEPGRGTSFVLEVSRS
jgi:two-component system NarL family sensor kinase